VGAVGRVLGGERFDLILMDLQMPRMDGYEAARRIREGGCSVPILAATAGVSSNERARSGEAGCDDLIEKPFGPDGLVARCGMLLGSAAGRSAA
jgi:DNA-binding response OmpR family regulator